MQTAVSFLFGYGFSFLSFPPLSLSLFPLAPSIAFLFCRFLAICRFLPGENLVKYSQSWRYALLAGGAGLCSIWLCTNKSETVLLYGTVYSIVPLADQTLKKRPVKVLLKQRLPVLDGGWSGVSGVQCSALSCFVAVKSKSAWWLHALCL